MSTKIDFKSLINAGVAEIELPGGDSLAGVVLKVSDKFLLMQEIGWNFRANGYAVIPLAAIFSVRAPEPHEAATQLLHAGLLPVIPCDLPLDSWENIVTAVSKRSVTAVCHCRYRNDHYIMVGQFVGHDAESLRIHEIDPDGIREKDVTSLKYGQCHALAFGSGYEAALTAVALDALPPVPAESPDLTLEEAVATYSNRAVFEFQIENHDDIMGVITGISAKFLLVRVIDKEFCADGFTLLRIDDIAQWRFHEDPSYVCYRVFQKFHTTPPKGIPPADISALTSLAEHATPIMILLRDGSIKAGTIAGITKGSLTLAEFDSDAEHLPDTPPYPISNIVAFEWNTAYLTALAQLL